MTNPPGAPAFPYNLFWWWPAAASGQGEEPGAGVGGFAQPILPGWSFGNVTVNEANSNAPDTEQRIVAQKSYGLQIGVLLDAVAALAADPDRKAADTRKALAAAIDLETQINAIKAKAVTARVDRMEADLEALRLRPDKTAFATAAARLQAYLTEHGSISEPS